MRGLVATVVLLLALAVSSQPVYDEQKLLLCPNYFPNTKSYANSALNETLNHLEGDYFHLMPAIDKALDSVVNAEAAACLKIIALVDSVGATKAPAPTAAPAPAPTAAPAPAPTAAPAPATT